MKLQCTQENLDKALSNISRAVSTRTTLPITQNVLLKATEGKLQLSATNLELALNTWIGADINTEGETTIPARLLTDLIKTFPNQNIDLSSDDQTNNINIKCGPFDSNLITQSSDEFPPIPELNDMTPHFTINSNDLLKLINSVIFSAAQDQSRPVLTGIKFSIQDNTLTMASADGFRLSIIHHKIEDKVDDLDFIVPSKSLAELSRILPMIENPVNIFITSAANQVIFMMDNYQLTTTLTQGTFPDFNSLIPDNTTTQCSIPKSDFKSAVRSLGVLAKDGSGIIKIEIDEESNNKLLMSAKTDELGENSVVIPVTTSGKSSKIAFNSKYLSDVLDVIDTENVILEINGDSNPGLIKPTDDSQYTHIVMPMFVQNW
ncbi:DNA polymerase III subunit beta [Chloroflexi bacterium]|nr:DNA polymerase III subunit beta [Chloroflexota bacterium]|tara:strand:- start:1661 stop:2788 length:1128 start_codon:yes stop_codon:yes gene_type:complete